MNWRMLSAYSRGSCFSASDGMYTGSCNRCRLTHIR